MIDLHGIGIVDVPGERHRAAASRQGDPDIGRRAATADGEGVDGWGERGRRGCEMCLHLGRAEDVIVGGELVDPPVEQAPAVPGTDLHTAVAKDDVACRVVAGIADQHSVEVIVGLPARRVVGHHQMVLRCIDRPS